MVSSNCDGERFKNFRKEQEFLVTVRHEVQEEMKDLVLEEYR